MRKRLTLLLIALLTAAAPMSEAAATSDDVRIEADPTSGRYVVVLTSEPLVSSFGQDGLTTAAAARRDRTLRNQHAKVLDSIGVDIDRVTHEYTTSLNGFSVELSDLEADKLRTAGDVLMVLPDVMRFKQTDSTPDYLGLTASGGAYDTGLDGSGVVVGVIDSGIWPEHPSFADDGSYPQPSVTLSETERPSCSFGNSSHNSTDEPFACNNKLIGARQMLDTYRSAIGAALDEYDSARDDDGHGTHTASTAAGNAAVEAETFGIPRGQISGIAPRAHIIAYKALGNLGGFTSDLAAAIDQAVADGVDVINYSIGGAAGAPGADELAFLFAADAGVHVAASAGNAGPGAGTVGSPGTMPWLTTVAASTQERFFEGIVHLGNRKKLAGASITPGTSGRFELIDAENAGGDLCVPGTLDSGSVEGKIVLCRRGAIGRAEKSLAVAEAGGVGMVLYNNSDSDNLFTDSHFVPTVHLDFTEGLEVKDYIAVTKQPPTARLIANDTSKWKPNPSVTIFSARGPNLASDIIKPDITAPGLQILAGYSPTPDPRSTAPGEMFAAIAGTSMSSPHVAGLFALIDQAHPDWSPAAVKSALMTTASDRVVDNDRVTPADPFDMGSGHVVPGRPSSAGSSFDPGLVYDAGFLDHLGWLCGTFPDVFSDAAATCDALTGSGVPTDPSDLNYPSIAVADLAGTQTVTRTVTSVANESRTYRVSVDEPAGYDIEVEPSVIELAPGASATVQINISNSSAPLESWAFGSLTWKSGRYKAKSPIALRAVALNAPDVVTGDGVDGAADFAITFGYTGFYQAATHGLEAAATHVGNVSQDPDQTFDPSDVTTGGANLVQVTTSGSALLRIALPPEATQPDADIDIYVLDSSGAPVGQSTAGGTNELVDVVLPADDTYDIFIHGWSAPGGAVDYTLFTWVISATPGGTMNLDGSPASAVVGTSANVAVSWTGALAGEWHLGAVSHTGPEGLLGLTLVEVDNR